MSNEIPEAVRDVAELEELLSRPNPRVVEMMKRLDGDLMVIGATGKVGPHVARVALRAIKAAGIDKKVYVVARSAMDKLESEGAIQCRCDLQDLDAVAKLPKVKNVVFLVGFKFGAEAAKSQTWAINALVPYHVARHFQGSRIVSYSTGCVYPVMHVMTGGADETTLPEPVGEYAQSCLARERVFDHFAEAGKEEVLHFRLNYAVECRYGVLYDIATKVWSGMPVDVTTGYANVLWQGDVANETWMCLEHVSSPATIMNITGPETFSVRWAAKEFGRLMGKEPVFSGEENGMAYLNNSAKATGLFGYPTVSLTQVMALTANWIMNGGPGLGKPTHFETQNGKY